MNEMATHVNDLVRKVRDGLLLAPSRTYGEQYVEPFIRAKYNFSKPKGADYDAMDKDGKKYEIKSSKVLIMVKSKETLIDRIVFGSDNVEVNRVVAFKDREKTRYNANIQNVKRDHFDYLIYVLLFEDCVKIFKVEKSKINSEGVPSWSDKHGRYDALGKSGQFPIGKNNIRYHLDNYLMDTVTYEEMTDVFKELSGKHVS